MFHCVFYHSDFLRLSGRFCDHQQSPLTGSCCRTLSGAEQSLLPPAESDSKLDEAPLLDLPALPTITDLLEKTIWRQREPSPAFIEFDMSVEGFGCLFIPSLAPQRVSDAAAGGVTMCAGGVGIGNCASTAIFLSCVGNLI